MTRSPFSTGSSSPETFWWRTRSPVFLLIWWKWISLFASTAGYSFGVTLYPAVEAKSEIHFHQISRKTGERVRHQKVSGDEEPVEKGDLVMGYEYRKGEYVQI